MIGQNPFTPRSGQEPKAFVGRDKETEVFKKHLKNAFAGKFEHFIVTGGWGTGKTTLLKEFKKITHSRDVLSSALNVPEFTGKDLLAPVLNLITQLPRNLPVKGEKLKAFYESMQGLGISFPVVGGGINFSKVKKYEGDPQVLLLDSLVKLWDSLKKDQKAVVVFLDDVQNYNNIPEFLTLLKNVLSDSEIVEKTGFLFVLSSTNEGWSSFLQKFNPVGRYFIPILRLDNIERSSVKDLILTSLKGTGVSFSDDVVKSVFDITEGHPFLIQIICSYLFENQIKGKVTSEQVDTSLNQVIDELSPIVLDPLYNLASEQEKNVLRKLSAAYKVYSFEEIQSLAGNVVKNKGPLSTTINRLCEKGLMIKTGRGRYRVVNKIFNIYFRRT